MHAVCNVALSISWADNVRLFDNIVRCSGEVPQGRIAQIWQGFHLYNPGWGKPVNNCEAFRNDVSMPRFYDGKIQGTEINVNEDAGNRAYENIIDGVLQGQNGERVFATPADEAELTRKFWEKVSEAGVTIGNGEIIDPPNDPPSDPPNDPEPDPDPDPATFAKADLIKHRNLLKSRRKDTNAQIQLMNAQIKQM